MDPEHSRPSSIDDRYEVGKAQNYPENLLLFLQRNAGDPAVRVSNLFGNSFPY
jgi:hypothetical protein